SPSGAGHSGSAQMNRGETTGRSSEGGMKSEGGMRDSQTDQMRSGEKATGKNAQDNERATGRSAQERDKASGRSARDNEKETGKSAQHNKRQYQKGSRSDTTKDRSKAGMKTEKNATDNNARSGTTTGQAGSGGKLTTEQRTQVRDVITKQNVKSVTNVN